MTQDAFTVCKRAQHWGAWDCLFLAPGVLRNREEGAYKACVRSVFGWSSSVQKEKRNLEMETCNEMVHLLTAPASWGDLVSQDKVINSGRLRVAYC